MARVFCVLPNASNLINGVRFYLAEGKLLSEEIPDDIARAFAAIRGYVLHQPNHPAPVKGPAEDEPGNPTALPPILPTTAEASRAPGMELPMTVPPAPPAPPVADSPASPPQTDLGSSKAMAEIHGEPPVNPIPQPEPTGPAMPVLPLRRRPAPTQTETPDAPISAGSTGTPT